MISSNIVITSVILCLPASEQKLQKQKHDKFHSLVVVGGFPLFLIILYHTKICFVKYYLVFEAGFLLPPLSQYMANTFQIPCAKLNAVAPAFESTYS